MFEFDLSITASGKTRSLYPSEVEAWQLTQREYELPRFKVKLHERVSDNQYLSLVEDGQIRLSFFGEDWCFDIVKLRRSRKFTRIYGQPDYTRSLTAKKWQIFSTNECSVSPIHLLPGFRVQFESVRGLDKLSRSRHAIIQDHESNWDLLARLSFLEGLLLVGEHDGVRIVSLDELRQFDLVADEMASDSLKWTARRPHLMTQANDDHMAIIQQYERAYHDHRGLRVRLTSLNPKHGVGKLRSDEFAMPLRVYSRKVKFRVGEQSHALRSRLLACRAEALSWPEKGYAPQLSIHNAQVVHTRDSDRLGRVAVRLAFQSPGSYIMARVPTFNSEAIGSPSVGDQALVLLNSAFEYPTVVGVLHSQSRLAPSDDSGRFVGWKTREGLACMLDRQQKTLQLSGSQEKINFTLSEDGAKIDGDLTLLKQLFFK